jgi:hypothetical protein
MPSFIVGPQPKPISRCPTDKLPYNGPMRFVIATIAGVVLAAWACPGALAQEKTVPKAAAPAAAAKSKAETSTPAQQQQVVMPDAEKVVLLLRGTLNTLNDALQTGNFTVLRDMGAPGFRDANTAARLSQSFSDLASKGVDLSVVSIVAPQLTDPPALDQAKGLLRLKGYFPSQPVQINFEMLYQAVGGRWRLFGLSVQPGASTPPPPSAGAAR